LYPSSFTEGFAYASGPTPSFNASPVYDHIHTHKIVELQKVRNETVRFYAEYLEKQKELDDEITGLG